MSCHDIGRGMNSVVDKVIVLLDDGYVSLEAARAIIAACRKGVYWCDGNEYEAVASIRRCRCGKCLKVIKEGKPLFSVWDLPYDFPDVGHILDKGEIVYATDGFCETCFDEVLADHCGDADAGPKMRKYIMEHCGERSYLSDGRQRALF